MKHRLIYLLLSFVTGALYLVMGLWSLPEITAEADGLLPFDLRPFGYSAEEAEAFLNALSDEGRVFYAETQHLLDAVFPGLLAIWAAWTVGLLYRGAARWGLIAVAVLAGAADYRENALVARLLVGFDAEVAQMASRWTMAKSAAVTVVLVAILLAAGRIVWRRLRR